MSLREAAARAADSRQQVLVAAKDGVCLVQPGISLPNPIEMVVDNRDVVLEARGLAIVTTETPAPSNTETPAP